MTHPTSQKQTACRKPYPHPMPRLLLFGVALTAASATSGVNDSVRTFLNQWYTYTI